MKKKETWKRTLNLIEIYTHHQAGNAIRINCRAVENVALASGWLEIAVIAYGVVLAMVVFR